MQTQAQKLATLIMNTQVVDEPTLLAKALQGLTDFFASSLHAKNQPELLSLRESFALEGGKSIGWLIGQKTLGTAQQSALFNGFQAHLLDFDDVHAQVRGHPSSVILSALFASIDLSHAVEIDSRRFLTAYIIGVEVMARLGVALNPYHYNQGWHSTSTLGGIAATAALCYLHKSSHCQSALALAATQAAGLRLMFGSSVKALHAGLSAQTALRSWQLTQTGIQPHIDFLDGQQGFLAVYGASNTQLDLTDWGNSWRIMTPGLWFKNYTYCSAAAGIADAAQLLVKQGIDFSQIEQINLHFAPRADSALLYVTPQTPQQGRFSAEYIAALGILADPLDNSAFVGTEIKPEIQRLMLKMRRQYDLSDRQTRAISLKQYGSSSISFLQKVENPKGSPLNPYSDEELAQKLTAAIQDSILSEEFIGALHQLTQGGNISDFIQQFLLRL